MAVTMRGEAVLPADRLTVWTKLNDPAVLKRCISGIHAMERTGENTFAASVKVKIGPVSTTFRGTIELSNTDPPNRYRISGTGEGGLAGFAKGSADVTLTAVPEGTLLAYDVQAAVGGKIAQIGARLVDGVAKKTADAFFARFAAECVGPPGEGAPVAEAPEPVG